MHAGTDGGAGMGTGIGIGRGCGFGLGDSSICPQNSGCREAKSRPLDQFLNIHSRYIQTKPPLCERFCIKILLLYSHYEQPVVEPHVSHFWQVPFRIKVKWAHVGQASPV